MGQHLFHHHHAELDHDTSLLCVSLFNQMDADHQGTINIAEAKEWWHSNYSVINSRAMFEAVDSNHDGNIELKEWLSFWQMVKSKGHTDDEIQQELLNIQSKSSWVQLEGLPQMQAKERD